MDATRGDEPMIRISVFLSVFDVHVQRVPAAGEVVRVSYHPGKFLSADLDKASEENERNGLVIDIASVTDTDELLLVSEQGQIIRMTTGDLRPIGRDTQGVKLMDMAEGDKLVSIATLNEV